MKRMLLSFCLWVIPGAPGVADDAPPAKPSGSVYERLGLQNGQAIVEIDGEPVVDPDSAVRKLGERQARKDCGPVPPGGSMGPDCRITVLPAPSNMR